MSRSGYTYDADQWEYIMYRGAVASSIRGKRGQDFLKELLAALDAMEVKELISGELEVQGQFCMLGVIGKARSIDMSNIDPEASEVVSREFNIADSLAREIVYMNDEGSFGSGEETYGQRWIRSRAWVAKQIIPATV
jgi:hypothetical protein